MCECELVLSVKCLHVFGKSLHVYNIDTHTHCVCMHVHACVYTFLNRQRLKNDVNPNTPTPPPLHPTPLPHSLMLTL